MARPSRIPAGVLSIMRDGNRHAWTIKQLSGTLARRKTPAEFSALFRALERMVSERTLDKVTIGNAPAYYEPHGAHHDHLYCIRCGKLIDIPCLAVQLDLPGLEEKTGFALGAHELILSGVCNECRTSRRERSA